MHVYSFLAKLEPITKNSLYLLRSYNGRHYVIRNTFRDVDSC